MDFKKCTVCNIKIDEDVYKKRNICKNCYNNIRKKYNNNTFSRIDNNKTTASYKQPKFGNVKNNSNRNRTFIIGFSNCGKTYLMKNILHQKQEPIFIITKSINQYPKIKAQTSDGIQSLENYTNSCIVFDDVILSKQESNIDLFFTRGRHINIDVYYISQSYFLLPKKLSVITLIHLFYLMKLLEISYCCFMI